LELHWSPPHQNLLDRYGSAVNWQKDGLPQAVKVFNVCKGSKI
jgi:hypothetical protein